MLIVLVVLCILAVVVAVISIFYDAETIWDISTGGEHLESGYKITDKYAINLRKLLKKIGLKEKYDFDRWLDE